MLTKRAISFLVLLFITVSFAGCKRDPHEYEYYSTYVDKTEVQENAEVDNSSNESSIIDTNTSKNSNTLLGYDSVKDKPSSPNGNITTANLLNHMSSKSDNDAIKLRTNILSAKDNVTVSGKKYYISNNGNDDNDGTSPKTAWKTIKKLSNAIGIIRKGDAVLFERGGIFRGTFSAISGVYYGAYGNGDKPCIYGSKTNFANYNWYNYSDNIWVAPKNFGTDVGIIVFNHGENVGDKKLKFSLLEKEFDFYCEAGRVFLYMKSDPSTLFSSIEIGDKSHIISIPSESTDITIDNLCLRYSGAHGVQVSSGVKNITVKNCEIGWIGGCLWSGDTRYGNGIEFWAGCENVLVDHCWVYQIYDSALSHQGSGEFVVKNLTFSNNLLEFSSYGSIEYWAPEAAKNELQNILYDGNIMRFAGYGWGSIGRTAPGIHLCGNSANKSTNFIIKNNTFDVASKLLINVVSTYGTLPQMENNTYIQTVPGFLGVYGESSTSTRYQFNNDVQSVITNIVKDKNGKAIIP